MILADTPYSNSISGYVITILLSIIMLGGGYIIKQLINAVSTLTDEVEKVKLNIALLKADNKRKRKNRR